VQLDCRRTITEWNKLVEISKRVLQAIIILCGKQITVSVQSDINRSKHNSLTILSANGTPTWAVECRTLPLHRHCCNKSPCRMKGPGEGQPYLSFKWTVQNNWYRCYHSGSGRKRSSFPRTCNRTTRTLPWEPLPINKTLQPGETL